MVQIQERSSNLDLGTISGFREAVQIARLAETRGYYDNVKTQCKFLLECNSAGYIYFEEMSTALTSSIDSAQPALVIPSATHHKWSMKGKAKSSADVQPSISTCHTQSFSTLKPCC